MGNNFAYIDGANLHKGIESLNWKFDYKRFRVWLREKYSVEQAYLFLGFVPKYKDLYTRLQEYGYTLVFKEVIFDGEGKAKGNCDADLVLQAARDAYESKFDKAVIVSSDGDFYSLARHLYDSKKLLAVLSPHRKTCSSLLRKSAKDKMVYMDNLRDKLAKRKSTA